MGPKAKKNCVDPPSMVKRICGATGCGLEVRGCDLARHYRNRTDFNLLKKMNNMSSKAADRREGARNSRYAHCIYVCQQTL